MTTTLYRNGKVFTGTGPDHFTSAFEVTDGVFSWVGEESDAPYKADSDVDLSGATVIPGLIEAHEHALIVAGIANSTACTIPAVTDIPSMIEALRKNPPMGKDRIGGSRDGGTTKRSSRSIGLRPVTIWILSAPRSQSISSGQTVTQASATRRPWNSRVSPVIRLILR